MSDKAREAAIARCETIMREAGFVSLIVAADHDGHSYGIQLPESANIRLLNKDDVVVVPGSNLADIKREYGCLWGLAAGAESMHKSVQALMAMLVEKGRYLRGVQDHVVP